MTVIETDRFVKLPGDEELRPLAFLMPQEARPAERPPTCVEWTDEARDVLARLAAHLKPAYLPTRSLRTLLEIHVPRLLRVDERAGTREDGRGVLGWADADDQADVFKGAMTALARWVNGTLGEDCAELPGALAALDDLRDLYRERRLLRVRAEQGQVFDWSAFPNGTASPGTSTSYSALADAVARALEGEELFEGLGATRRVVQAHLRGEAELVSEPVRRDVREPFSLVVRVRVLTLPTLSRPLVEVDLSKRRWVADLNEYPKRGNVTGFVFGVGETTAHPFTISAGQGEYTVNGEFKELARKYDFGPTTDGRVAMKIRNEHAEVLVNLRAGYGRHKVDAGVPERDKVDAFTRIRSHLERLGFVQWDDVTPVRTKNAASASSAFVDIDDEAVNEARMEAWLAQTRDALPRYHARGSVLLIAHHVSCQQDAELARDTLRRVLGDAVQVEAVPLPEGVHGLREELPGPDLGARARARKRQEAWAHFTANVSELNARSGVVGVLVLAPQEYGRRDEDRVNKRMGRHALATLGRVPVQYLLPPDKSTKDPVKDFRMRLHNAWMHLVWGHHGRVDDVGGNAERLFPMLVDAERLFPVDTAPQVVLGFTAIQRNRKKFENDASFVALAFRMHVRDGRVEAAFAYEDKRKDLAVTQWKPLRDTLLDVAAKSPMNLNADRKNGTRQAQYQTFVHGLVEAEVRAGTRPLVIVDSTHAVRLWPWLADNRLDVGDVQFRELAKRNMQLPWLRAGLRLVRVRRENAPQVVVDKTVRYVNIETGETQVVHAPTWLAAQLLRIGGTRVPTYFSFGSKLTFQGKRGVSCYRSSPVFKGVKEKHDGRTVYVADKDAPPFMKHRATPNPVEISVLLQQPGDDANRVAEFVESLRSGYGHHADWTNLPAPLFFERVVQEYLADFDDPELDEDDGA
ncbi:DUF3893 domain-containing protein [Deinococcus aerius]|uniref:DUF3893 domain-containing protein n=1 Tax=Deinococcus aerius TaxID=200253 RepID=A0A2I9DH71_9DEIO|nr:RNaseH domain-containing protein [Deinococcus aerius]GBF05518.1 DUF3893 domain-containing protein [Deinococcus aerius]